MTELDQLARKIVGDGARMLGIPAWGICRLGDLSRFNPYSGGREALPQSGSVIMFLLPYFAGVHQKRNIALYAAANDYHNVFTELQQPIRSALSAAFPNAVFGAFIDGSPIPEKEAACRAGLGFCGKNRLLINEQYGSFVHLGEIVTDLELTPDEPVCGGCGDCRSCIDACPTGALSEEGFDTEKCLSRITQKSGELTEWEQKMLQKAGTAWGCDICALACPHNRALPRSPINAFTEDLQPYLTPALVPGIIDSKAWRWRGDAVILRNLEILNRR